MAFNVSEVITQAIEARDGSVADSVTEHNAALRVIKKSGGVKTFDGGSVIQEAVQLRENGNVGSYSGADVLATGLQETMTSARFGIAQYAAPVVITGLDIIQNSGKAKIIDKLSSAIENAENSLANRINRDIYLDGTGNAGKNLTGLAAALPLANTTGIYGGINRAEEANWRNKKYQASVDGSGVATSSTILAQWEAFLLQLARGTDKPNCIITGGTLFSLFKSAMLGMKMLTTSGDADSGFETVSFNGIPVYHDTAASGISPNVAYFLNTNYLRWRPFSGRDMKSLGVKNSLNQDVNVHTIVWAGNLTCRSPKFSGVYSNT